MKIHYKRHENFPLCMSNAALLVIDMQNYFTDSKSHAYISETPQIIENINSLIRNFKRSKRPVFFTRHIDKDENNLMNRWWNDSILKNSKLSEIDSRIDTSEGVTIIKHQYDAFLGTKLEDKLTELNITQVVITGVVSHICCETTARSAFMRNFVPFFVTDATASFDKEHHKAAILNLAHAFAVPVRMKDLIISHTY